eukprot:g7918.t1
MTISEDWINPDLHFRHLYGRAKNYDEVLDTLDCRSLKSMILTNHELLEIHSNSANEDGSFNVVLLDNDQVAGWVDVPPLLDGCRAFLDFYKLAAVGRTACGQGHQEGFLEEDATTHEDELTPLDRIRGRETGGICSGTGAAESRVDVDDDNADSTPSEKAAHLRVAVRQLELHGSLRKYGSAVVQQGDVGADGETATVPSSPDQILEVESRSVYRKTSRDLLRDATRRTLESLRNLAETSGGLAAWALHERFHRRFGRILGALSSAVTTTSPPSSAVSHSQETALTWDHVRNFAVQAIALYLDRVTQHITLKSLPFFNLGNEFNLGFLFHKVDIVYEHSPVGFFRFDVILWLAEQVLLKKMAGRTGGVASEEENFHGAPGEGGDDPPSPALGAATAAKIREMKALKALYAGSPAASAPAAPRPTLKIAEVGVEKGETVRYVLQKLGEHIDYYAVIDPYFMDGKPSLDAVLEYYSQNVTEVCEQHNERVQATNPNANQPCRTHRLNSLDYAVPEEFRSAGRGTSGDGGSEMKDDGVFDLIFLDADHSFHSVSNDVAFYARLLKRGGVLAGHDFSKDHLQVVLAVLVYFSQLESEADGGGEEVGRIKLHLGMETVWFVYRENW